MKTLTIMRHSEAIADLSEDVKTDFDKPLTDRGINILEKVGDFLKEKYPNPDYIVCSPAVRTKQTLQWLQAALGEKGEVFYENKLYGANSDTLIDILLSLPREKEKVLLIGHNPSISDVANIFYSRIATTDRPVIDFPFKPSQLISFSFNLSEWTDILTTDFSIDFVWDYS